MMRRCLTLLSCTLILLLALGRHAEAWKPTTHLFLAEVALQDALDDGKISIYRVNY